MRFKGTVTVALKEGIFDPQGAAVKGSLDALGYAQVRRVRMGKDIVIDLEAGSVDEAKTLLEDMARKLLANPVTELFRISVTEAGEAK
ncbi:MAG: phosphoribosylformylglycinamidine synthase subunit PurS [Bacillota bacterium]